MKGFGGLPWTLDEMQALEVLQNGHKPAICVGAGTVELVGMQDGFPRELMGPDDGSGTQ